jgi:hypothetical protein
LKHETAKTDAYLVNCSNVALVGLIQLSAVLRVRAVDVLDRFPNLQHLPETSTLH